jgi:hypothetical protein
MYHNLTDQVINNKKIKYVDKYGLFIFRLIINNNYICTSMLK